MSDHSSIDPQDPIQENVAGVTKMKVVTGNGAGPIPDPGTAPASKYAAAPTFAEGGAIRQFTSVTPDHPRTYCRAFPNLAVLVWMVNLARAKDTGKKLHVITPEAVAEGAVDGLIEPYQAWAVPMIDRDSHPFLWCIRQFNNDGQELDSYGDAMKAVEAAAEEWQKIWWSGGWNWDKAPNPGAMRHTIPTNLKTIDDWIEGAFAGRVIRRAKAEELERGLCG